MLNVGVAWTDYVVGIHVDPCGHDRAARRTLCCGRRRLRDTHAATVGAICSVSAVGAIKTIYSVANRICRVARFPSLIQSVAANVDPSRVDEPSRRAGQSRRRVHFDPQSAAVLSTNSVEAVHTVGSTRSIDAVGTIDAIAENVL